MDAHGLLLGSLSVCLLLLISTPDALHSLSKQIREIVDILVELVLDVLFVLSLLHSLTLLLLINRLLKLVSDDLLQHILPDSLFQPDTVIVDKLSQPHFVESELAACRGVDIVVLLMVQQLTHIQNGVNHFEIYISFVNNGSQ